MVCSDEISSSKNICGVQENIMKTKKYKESVLKNGLYIIATPIGNLNDLSKRAILIIKEVDLIICENPKHSIKLLNKLGIKKKLIALHDYNEEIVIKKISKYQHNKKIGLLSDAGSPLISDPGFKLVRDYINKDIMITSIPGPSSLVTSLQMSGLPVNNFTFYGFASKNNKKRKDSIEQVIRNNITSVFFVSGKNLENFIHNINELCGVREISICKELTKINEAIIRGTSKEIYKKIIENKLNLKGEFTVVIASSVKKIKKSINNKIQNEISSLLKKFSLTETVKIVHNLTDIPKKDVYQIAIKIKDE